MVKQIVRGLTSASCSSQKKAKDTAVLLLQRSASLHVDVDVSPFYTLLLVDLRSNYPPYSSHL